MDTLFTQVMKRVEESYAKSPNIESLFGCTFLDKLHREGECVLLHWFVRFLVRGPESVQHIEQGIERIKEKDTDLIGMLQDKIKVLVNHDGRHFRDYLSAIFAEIQALEYFLSESDIGIERLVILDERKSSKKSRSPDFMIRKTSSEEVYAEVKFIQDSSEIESQFQNYLSKEALVNPDIFGYKFNVHPHIYAYQVDDRISNKFVQFCISQLAKRKNSVGKFNLESPEFPQISARFEVEEGQGISVFHGTQGGGGVGQNAQTELLLLGHLYSVIINRIHSAFVQLSEFHEQNRKGRVQDDWIYLKVDAEFLSRFAFQDIYPATIGRLVQALNLPECVNVVIGDQKFIRS